MNWTATMLPAAVGLVVSALSALDAPAAVVALAGAAAAWSLHHLLRRAPGSPGADPAPAMHRRQQQMAHTAHELRTPLTAVATAIEMLRDGYATTAEDRTMFLDQASVAARHMMFVINDMVDLAALENGRISLHIGRQRVQELFFDVAQVMQLTAQARGIALHIDEPPEDLQVMADRGRFLQIVFNLVANAIKYSEPGQVVRLTAAVGVGHVAFEVRDSGRGIEPPDCERLFTRFGRVGEQGPGVAGTGLGLHVSKLLIERMNGSIGHRPGPERGSVFWFRLPQAPTPRPSAVAELQLAQA